MRRSLRYMAIGLVVFVAALAAAQLIRPERTNPATDPSRTIRAHPGTTHEFAAILDRACRDCHSNETRWPAYTEVAPLSWLAVYGVNEARGVLNFSEWAGYSAEQQRGLLAASCEDVSSGKMPGGFYTFLYPEARLSAQGISTICTAARQSQAQR